MKTYTSRAYRDAGCQFEALSLVLFLAVHIKTAGKVCDTGCALFENGKCGGYQSLILPAKTTAGQRKDESVRESAKRLGISIKEMRRRRAAI